MVNPSYIEVKHHLEVTAGFLLEQPYTVFGHWVQLNIFPGYFASDCVTFRFCSLTFQKF